MEPDDLLCSRNARPRKGERGATRPSFLLAERSRSECARPTRAVKDSLATPQRYAIQRSVEECVGHAQWETNLAYPQGSRRKSGDRSMRAVDLLGKCGLLTEIY